MKVKVSALIFSLLLLLCVTPSYAMRQGVLGLTTTNVSLSPTVEGPGLFLPDSPFYFLDKLKQHVRLFFAVTPQMKAKVYASVAGERLAELRFELAKNNTDAAEVALDGVRENTRQAALSLDNARMLGANVENDAADINRQIKEHLVSLDALELGAAGEMRAAVAYATQTLADAKAVVEDGMRKDLIENEVKDDISREVAKKLLETTLSAQQVKSDLDELQQEATSEAQKALPNRKDALQKIISEEKNAGTQKKQQPNYQQATNYVNDIILQAQKAATTWQQTHN